MKNIYTIFLLTLLLGCKQKVQETKTIDKNPAKELIIKMVDKVGNYDNLKELKDVEYKYTFYDPNKKLKDVSLERYIFNSEFSWAKYNIHQVFVSPKTKDTITQYFDGKNKTSVIIKNKEITDKKTIYAAKFIRKANFYWFTMMQKLLDKGLTYQLLPNRSLNNIDYKIIKLGFENNIGDKQDDFVLYVNPKTHLIDQFLFTVKGSTIPQPLLMKISYEKVKGVHLMTKRDVYATDWEGNIKGHILYQQFMEDIKFTNGFSSEDLIKIH